MQALRRPRALLCTLAALLLAGCLMPKGGTPVFVDLRAGDFWSGKGVLLEVSEDQKQCRVAVRDRALFVHELWTECRNIHPRRQR
jgi:hypothetical protein